MVRMICLANSWRDGGRCVAGISLLSERWIRPIPPGGGPIPDERTPIDGRYLVLLDVVEIDLAEPTFSTRYQRENREMRDTPWRIVGRIEPRTLLAVCRRSPLVLHGPLKTVEPAHLEALDPADWRSLELVHAENVSFVLDPRKKNRWQAKFSLGPHAPEYVLSVTDPEITGRLNYGDRISPRCLLTVSLTEPTAIPEYNLPSLCYKIVAGVIEL
jgi:hypothetical protein